MSYVLGTFEENSNLLLTSCMKAAMIFRDGLCFSLDDISKFFSIIFLLENIPADKSHSTAPGQSHDEENKEQDSLSWFCLFIRFVLLI